ncbi:sporulation protein, YlmC/YmxH family [Salinibacillus kushneri]|uniref:Sporulation protein, YlmC/YmxH family n=1 Tax=Salinibacillus kushneri TaxID=237682 RepID=A0A1I0HM56_9BACI|nr:YlmC/YmxH family sporulation protein [Salinibacillus kushneri]SET85098.1 sporulation protein, YlmC/YmxH family [Salinibacillus kushneri]
MTISELQVKDIVAVEDGRKLGYISDLEIDVDKGYIVALIIALKGKMFGLFGKDEEITIPWNHIVTIGADVILVRTENQKLTHNIHDNQYDVQER